MLMMCWFYCIPFAKFLYFAMGPFLIIFSLFVLKRGIKTARSGLRQTAIITMFFAVVKMCLFDVRMLKKEILCGMGNSLREIACNKTGFIVIELGALAVLLGVSVFLFHLYRVFLKMKKPLVYSPEQVHLRFWANLTFVVTSVFTVWVSGPWVGFLVVGRTPGIFDAVPWQLIATINLVLLLVGFWKSESCVWVRSDTNSRANKHLNNTWTSRDTLWLTAFFYTILIAFSYVSHDVIARGNAGQVMEN
jgi:hypothetical protein